MAYPNPPGLRIVACLFIGAAWTGCTNKENPSPPVTDILPVYTLKDSILQEGNGSTQMIITDRRISVDQNASVYTKMMELADTLSTFYFQDLEIDVMKIDTVEPYGPIATINLVENPAYTGPGSLPSQQTWYNYFQGSLGGQTTTTLLKETFLQRAYAGDWVKGIVFFYQGDSIGVWDHISLEGIITR